MKNHKGRNGYGGIYPLVSGGTDKVYGYYVRFLKDKIYKADYFRTTEYGTNQAALKAAKRFYEQRMAEKQWAYGLLLNGTSTSVRWPNAHLPSRISYHIAYTTNGDYWYLCFRIGYTDNTGHRSQASITTSLSKISEERILEMQDHAISALIEAEKCDGSGKKLRVSDYTKGWRNRQPKVRLRAENFSYMDVIDNYFRHRQTPMPSHRRSPAKEEKPVKEKKTVTPHRTKLTRTRDTSYV